MLHQKMNKIQKLKFRKVIKNKNQAYLKNNKKNTLKIYKEEEIHNCNGINRFLIKNQTNRKLL
jgi:hypothetical protein